MSAPHVIAVDLGGTKLAAGLVDREGAVLNRTVEPTDLSGEEAILDQLERVIGAVAGEGFSALGVGVPSTIDQRTGRAVTSVNIPLAGVDLRDRLEARFGVPVMIENDGNAAAVAEHRLGAGRGAQQMIMLTLGTGVGGGLILDGRLYRGAVGAAGELGHITIDVDGPPCQGACPGRGHLEALASGLAANELAAAAAAEHPDGDLGRAAADGRVVDARLAVELAAQGEGDARDVLDHVGFHLGVGIASYVNIFNPEIVVIGGGFAEAGELLLVPARKVVSERALPPGNDDVGIVLAELGSAAGLVGAGLVAFEALDAGEVPVSP
ncbi:MAG TPA: ROK family protein [Gaiellaceae bacterium]|jgi:glucokinase|nr:ROK family protein [Gaiellaceae bacterium]